MAFADSLRALIATLSGQTSTSTDAVDAGQEAPAEAPKMPLSELQSVKPPLDRAALEGNVAQPPVEQRPLDYIDESPPAEQFQSFLQETEAKLPTLTPVAGGGPGVPGEYLPQKMPDPNALAASERRLAGLPEHDGYEDEQLAQSLPDAEPYIPPEGQATEQQALEEQAILSAQTSPFVPTEPTTPSTFANSLGAPQTRIKEQPQIDISAEQAGIAAALKLGNEAIDAEAKLKADRAAAEQRIFDAKLEHEQAVIEREKSIKRKFDENIEKQNAVISTAEQGYRDALEGKNNGWWANMSVPQNIGFALSAIIAGFGSGLAGSRTNAGIDLVNDAVKRGIAAKMDVVRSGKDKLSRMYQTFNDDKAFRDSIEVAFLKSLQADADRVANSFNTQQAQANAQKLKADLQLKINEISANNSLQAQQAAVNAFDSRERLNLAAKELALKQQIAEQQARAKGMAGPMTETMFKLNFAVPKEQRDAAIKELQEIEQHEVALSKLSGYYDELSKMGPTDLLSSKDRARMGSLESAIAATFIQLVPGLRSTVDYEKIIQPMIPNMANPLTSRDAALELKRIAQEFVKANGPAWALVDGYGLRPRPGSRFIDENDLQQSIIEQSKKNSDEQPVMSIEPRQIKFDGLDVHVPGTHGNHPDSYAIGAIQQANDWNTPAKLASGKTIASINQRLSELDEDYRKEVLELTADSSKMYGIDQGLLLAVFNKESHMDGQTFSYKDGQKRDAQGIAQFVNGTWKEVTRKVFGQELDESLRLDNKFAIPAAAFYLKELVDRYDGDVALALKAYNQGSANVDRALQRIER